MSHAFISHGADNLDTLLEAHEVLRQAGIPTRYMTAADAAQGRGNADRLIEEAAFVLLLVSAAAMHDRDVRLDVERARSRGVSILPVRIDRSRLSGHIRQHLADHLKISLLDPTGYADLAEEARRRYRTRCPILAVMNLKGGVGKTTLTAQLAGALQKDGTRRILLIDFDPQYNLTQLFFSMAIADESAAADRSVLSLFEKSRLHQATATSPADNWSRLSTEPFPPAPREQLVHSLFGENAPAGRLDLITGQFELSKYAFAHNLSDLEAVQANFLRVVEHYRSLYDIIIFDTNPTATFLTRCVLTAADRVLAPMHPDVYSLRGVRLLNKVITDQLPADIRPDLSVLFNAVSRSEQTDFEADTRNGTYDELVGFPLSRQLLTAAVPRSGHLNRVVDEETPPWRRLVMFEGRGGGLRAIREDLASVAAELDALFKQRAT